MKLIVGLGNPGLSYHDTRHNVGFKCIDKLCDNLNISLSKNKFNGDYYSGVINNMKVIILKPQTYMNLSGECVKEFVNYFKIDIKDILIIYDDMDTDVGKIRVRFKGSSGGQNGIKNIINHLHSEQIPRIRIGIGKNSNYQTKDFVLSKFTNDEQDLVNEAILKASKAAQDFLTIDFEKIMSKYNK